MGGSATDGIKVCLVLIQMSCGGTIKTLRNLSRDPVILYGGVIPRVQQVTVELR